jgi:serine/threonine protein kinase
VVDIVQAKENHTAPQAKQQRPLYSDVFGVEVLNDFERSRFHLVTVDDVLPNGRYQIAHKVGLGGFGVVELGTDHQASRYVAPKINKARHSESVAREISALGALKGAGAAMPELLDVFEVEGPNG